MVPAVLTDLISIQISIQNARTCQTHSERDLSHDLRPSITRESPQPAHTASGHDPGCPSIGGRTPLQGQTGDRFSHWRLAQCVSRAGSGGLHQVDVLDPDGTGAWRSGDVESCLDKPAAVPVHFARKKRCAQATSCCSVVLESEPLSESWSEPGGASVDREIQGSASASESS